MMRWHWLLLCVMIAHGSGAIWQAPSQAQDAALKREVHARPSEPRIHPVEKADWTPDQAAYLRPREETGRLFNVFKTAARHPDLGRSFDALAFGHINGATSTLSPRHRELLILRIGWLCQCEYEWAQHSLVARSIGMTDEEIVRITADADAPGWEPLEATLLRAVDELHRDAMISDRTWQALAQEYDTRQLMDLVATVGTYNAVCMMLNSWGVQLDDGLTGFPNRN